MADRPQHPQPEQTTDLSKAGPSTAHRVDTSGFSVDPPDQKTGDYVPAGDASSVTGGYTATDMTGRVPGRPMLAGFEILGTLGRGGMGVVYKARQVALDRVVALKMILGGAHAQEKDLARFKSEARAVAQFQHPNIVQIFEVGEADGLPYFSLEFVPEGTLSAKINRDPQPPRYAAEMVESLARAMQYAHERGIIHRDLKPANVLLAADGTPKITDFGLAKQIDGDSGQTQAGQVLGTPSYMAPEQAYGDSEKITKSADIYALGGILYDLLTGRPPFSGTSVIETLEMVRTREPVPPGQLAAKLPRDLETITLKCLQKDPTRRYLTAGELADDLRRFLDGRPILARPVSSAEKAWRWAKRNPWVAGLGTGVAVLLITVAVVTSILSYRLSIKKNEAEESARQESIAKTKAETAREYEEIAKVKAEKDRATAAEQRRLALDTIRGILHKVDDLMKNDGRFVGLRRSIIDTMLEDLNRVRDHALKNPLEDRTEAIAYQRIGDIYMQIGRIQEGYPWLVKAHSIMEAVAEKNPNAPDVMFGLSGIKNLVADAEWRLGSSDKALQLYEEAFKIRMNRVPLVEALVKDKTLVEANLINARYSVAEQYGLVAYSHLRVGNLKEAIDNYEQSDRGFAALPLRLTGSLPVRRSRAEIQSRIGEARLRQGKFDEAEKHFKDALDERKELVRVTPKPPRPAMAVKSDLAEAYLAIGDFRLMAYKDAAAATQEYLRAFAIYEVLSKDENFKDDLDVQSRLSAAYYRLGYVADKHTGLAALAGGARPAAESVRHFAECAAIRSKLAAIDLKDNRRQIDLMVALARLGQAAEVEKMAKALRDQAGEDRAVLFQIACGLSIAGTGTDEVAKRCREQAFNVIASLIDRGWKDRGSLEFDPDLEGIRGEKRFQDVIKSMSRP